MSAAAHITSMLALGSLVTRHGRGGKGDGACFGAFGSMINDSSPILSGIWDFAFLGEVAPDAVDIATIDYAEAYAGQHGLGRTGA